MMIAQGLFIIEIAETTKFEGYEALCEQVVCGLSEQGLLDLTRQIIDKALSRIVLRERREDISKTHAPKKPCPPHG